MKLELARQIAEAVKAALEPACERIEIAGSIRREKPEVGDAEILCIPRYDGGIVDLLDNQIQELVAQHILDYRRNKLGSKTYGAKIKLMTHIATGFGIDIFSTTPECWAVSFVVRTGGSKTNVEIATAALRKGLHFNSYGRGFTAENGTEVVCHTEREVFETVGLKYLPPTERK
ncbi:MAG: hypothetical protein V1767_03560 [Chloroflexota bacterium]